MNTHKSSIISIAMIGIFSVFIYLIPVFVTLTVLMTSLIVISAVYFFKNHEIDFKFLLGFISQFVILVMVLAVFIVGLGFIAQEIPVY